MTTDGTPKIVDLIDCSGAGDVDTRAKRFALSDEIGGGGAPDGDKVRVRGLSGRTLLLNSSWSNPSGTWHVGAKRVDHLFPSDAFARVTRARLQRHVASQRAAQNAARVALLAHEDSDDGGEESSSSGAAVLSKRARKLRKDELEVRNVARVGVVASR